MVIKFLFTVIKIKSAQKKISDTARQEIIAFRKKQPFRQANYMHFKEFTGMMLQADGSSHDRLSNGSTITLHAFIDDSGGNITGLYFALNECLYAYPEVLRQTLQSRLVFVRA